MQHTDENTYWAEIAPSLRRAKRFDPYSADAIERDLRFADDETLATVETERVMEFVLASHDASEGPSKSSLRGDQFVDLVSSTGVLSPSDLQWLATLPRRSARHGPRQLTDALLRAGKLPRSMAAPDRAGAVFGEYLLLDEIGFGGMGRVYRAIQLSMDRVVALKVLRPNLLDIKRSVRRFEREIKAIGRLQHPHIVSAYDAGVSRDVCYLAMEYVDGCDLSRLVHRHNPLPLRLVLDYTIQAARGLEHAHQKHIVHRDVKPSNLLLGNRGIVKVSDLGLARFRRVDDLTVSEDEADMTEQGAALGTHSYMAPEQYEDAQQVDERADIYGLGCTLYFLLLGESPVHGLPVEQKIAWHRGGRIPRLAELRNDVSPQLDAVFQRMIARRRGDRYATMGEVSGALEACVASLAPEVAIAPRRVTAADREERPVAVASSTDGFTATVGSVDSASTTVASRTAGWRRVTRRVVPLAIVAAVVLLVWMAVMGIRATHLALRGATTNSLGMRLVRLPAGQFMIGASDDDAAAEYDEYPRHLVQLSRSAFIGETEVTRGQYARIMGDPPLELPDRAAFDLPPEVDPSKLPATRVSWHEARDFCLRLSNLPEEVRAGRRYRLPTEAEWEYACRAGTETRYYLGDEISTDQANFGGQVRRIQGSAVPVRPRLMEVGSFDANPYGLFDMHGNVWEWCLDRYGSYEATPAVDPQGPKLGEDRVVRGGGWTFAADECRSSNRQGFRPDVQNPFLGFRVVCETR